MTHKSLLINVTVTAGFYDKLSAIYLARASRADYETVVQSQSRKENAQAAPGRSTGCIREAEKFLCAIKIPALHRGDFSQVNKPFVIVIFGRTQIKFVRLSVLTGSFLHCWAALSEQCKWGNKPCPSLGSPLSLNLLHLATMAHEHDSFEFKSPLQAIPGLRIYRLRIVSGKELRHAFLLNAGTEKLQWELRSREWNFQEHITLLQNFAGWRVEGIGFHRFSLHQAHLYSTLPVLMIGAGVPQFPQMNAALAPRAVCRQGRNGNEAPVLLSLATALAGESYWHDVRVEEPVLSYAPWPETPSTAVRCLSFPWRHSWRRDAHSIYCLNASTCQRESRGSAKPKNMPQGIYAVSLLNVNTGAIDCW